MSMRAYSRQTRLELIKILEEHVKIVRKNIPWHGENDYVAKKIIIQKEKHLKFRDEEDKIVEYRSAAGLNYIIEDM